MTLKKPLAILDIESATRGKYPDPAVDRIVHLYIRIVREINPPVVDNGFLIPDPPEPGKSYLWKFNPGFLMSPENIAIHGITNEEAATYPPLDASKVREIVTFIQDCDLAGFGIRNYDAPIMYENFYSVGVELPLEGVEIIDASVIFKKKEERTLTAAMKFYLGCDHSGAHGAEADTLASLAVLATQRIVYDDLGGMDIPTLAKFSQQNDAIDLFGTIVRNEKGEPCFGTKRNRGVPIAADIGYARWILRSEFPANTRNVLQKIVDGIEGGNQQGGLF